MQVFFFFPKRSDRLKDPPCFLFIWYQGPFPGQNGWVVMPILMRGGVRPFTTYTFMACTWTALRLQCNTSRKDLDTWCQEEGRICPERSSTVPHSFFFPCVGDGLVNPSRKYCHFLFPLNVGFLPSGFPSVDCTDVVVQGLSSLFSMNDKSGAVASLGCWLTKR